MSRTHTAPAPGTVSQALARDRLGVPAVLAFILAGLAPLTVGAGPPPAAYAVTGLTGIPAGFVGPLPAIEIAVILAETAAGLARPAGGHLSFATLSPSALTAGGLGTAGVLAVIAVLGFSGFEQAPVLAEEARHPKRTI